MGALRLNLLVTPLKSTVTSKPFQGLKSFRNLANLSMHPILQKYFFLSARAMYAPMRILRLADQKIPAMDRQEFYVRQADVILPRYLGEVEAIAAELLTKETQSVLNATNDLASENYDEENSDSDEDSSEESDSGEIKPSAGSKWTTDSLTHQVMRLWEKCRSLLRNDYSLAAFILSPHPTIMAGAQLGKNVEHHDAAKRLIKELCLDPTLVGDAKRDKILQKLESTNIDVHRRSRESFV